MLKFPLSFEDKSIIEQTQFNQIKARQFKGGIPIFASVRTDKPMQGEIWVESVAGTISVNVYVNGVKKSVKLL